MRATAVSPTKLCQVLSQERIRYICLCRHAAHPWIRSVARHVPLDGVRSLVASGRI